MHASVASAGESALLRRLGAATRAPSARLRPRSAARSHRAPLTVRAASEGGDGGPEAPKDVKAAHKGLSLLSITGAIIPQGKLVYAVKLAWKTAWEVFMRELAPQSTKGGFVRPISAFAGADTALSPDAGRYVLYVGNTCPWCHRTTLALALRGLTGHVRVARLLDDATRASRGGWILASDREDPVFAAKDLREGYDEACRPDGYRGRCTAPLLVDSVTRRIVRLGSSSPAM